MANRWRRSPPDRDGWWQFDEDGIGKQFVMVADGCVVSDDEWGQAVGRPPELLWSENYWEGCDVVEMTTGPLTKGKWLYWGFVPDSLVRGRPLVVYYSFQPDSGAHTAWLSRVRWHRLGSRVH